MKFVDYIVEQLVEDECLSVHEQVGVINKKGKDNELERKRQLLILTMNHPVHPQRRLRSLARALLLSRQNELYAKIWRGEDLSGESCATLEYRVWCTEMASKPHSHLPTRLCYDVPPHLLKKKEEAKTKLVTEMKHVPLIVNQLKDAGYLSPHAANYIQLVHGEDQTLRLVEAVHDLCTYLLLAECLRTTQQTELHSALWESDMPSLHPKITDKLRFEFCREKYRSKHDSDGVYNKHHYVSLHVISEMKAPDRRGREEFVFDAERGETVDLEGIFDRSHEPSAKETQRSGLKVLVVGVPGAGKSHGCSHLVTKILDGKCKMPGRPTLKPLPVLIRLRDIRDRNTTLKDLVLSYIPHTTDDRDDTWRALTKYGSCITFIMDGADECRVDFVHLDPRNDQYISDPNHIAPVRMILASLLTGKLMPTSHILLTSRPFNLERCWFGFDSKLEIVGFREDTLKQFLQEELIEYPGKYADVWRFLQEHSAIMSLCFLPLHAVSLVDHVKYTKGDILLKSRTDFTVALITSYMREARTELKGDNADKEKAWRVNRQALRKLGQLGMKSLQKGNVMPRYRGEELSEAELTEDERRACGLLTANFAEYENERGLGVNTIYEVPHLTVMEFITALGLLDQDTNLDTIQHVADTNDGHFDLVLTYAASMAGNAVHRGLLCIVLNRNRDFTDEDFTEKAIHVVRAVLSTVRRVKYQRRMFPLKILSGIQVEQVITAASDYFSGLTFLARDKEDCQALTDMQKPDHVIVYVENGSLWTSLSEVTHLITRGVQHRALVDKVTSLKNITCLGLVKVGITHTTLAAWCDALATLPTLRNLSMSRNDLGQTREDDAVGSQLSSLHRLGALTSLRLSQCELKTNDAVCLMRGRPAGLINIDISYNEQVDSSLVPASDVCNLRCLLTEGCRWTDQGTNNALSAANNELVSLGIGNPESRLKREMWTMLWERCTRLEELHLEGQVFSDEYQEAIEVLNQRLTHLHLSQCDVGDLSGLGAVKHLSLVECKLSVEAVETLSESQVESLYVSTPDESSLHDSLATVCEAPCLTQLWIDGLTLPLMGDICSRVTSSLKTLGLQANKTLDAEYMASVEKITTHTSLTRLWLTRVEAACYHEMTKLDKTLSYPDPPHIISVCDNLYETYCAVSETFLPDVPLRDRQVLYTHCKKS